ncbi:hypothetical protein NE562_08920 [Butyricicoccus faecihominis]|uniref:hypothetical protein n=1 Tax=Butyricicoccus faecihominis TaxID=1712515 RepID=UPI00247862B3|nr:hypothetical protein [Butyricicoccus faecihominis]MCQ5129779.1 hypothetical protein [Butyricicoccus faecihominis]
MEALKQWADERSFLAGRHDKPNGLPAKQPHKNAYFIFPPQIILNKHSIAYPSKVVKLVSMQYTERKETGGNDHDT